MIILHLYQVWNRERMKPFKRYIQFSSGSMSSYQNNQDDSFKDLPAIKHPMKWMRFRLHLSHSFQQNKNWIHHHMLSIKPNWMRVWKSSTDLKLKQAIKFLNGKLSFGSAHCLSWLRISKRKLSFGSAHCLSWLRI